MEDEGGRKERGVEKGEREREKDRGVGRKETSLIILMMGKLILRWEGKSDGRKRERNRIRNDERLRYKA